MDIEKLRLTEEELVACLEWRPNGNPAPAQEWKIADKAFRKCAWGLLSMIYPDGSNLERLRRELLEHELEQTGYSPPT